MKNNPITIIEEDHKIVEALFKQYEELGDEAFATKRKVVDRIIHELTVHAEMEEQLCYERFKEVFNKEDDKMVAEAYVEHAEVKKLMSDLEKLEPEQVEFDASVKVLVEHTRHHIEEEENELLPAVKKQVPEKELAPMGDKMIAFKYGYQMTT